MFCVRLFSSTMRLGQIAAIIASLPSTLPAFCTSSSSVSNTFGVSGTCAPPFRRSSRETGSTSNSSNT